jgi:hypothetical protein
VLVSDPLQVAEITPAEIATLLDTQIVGMGTNIKYLSDAALKALTNGTGGRFVAGQISSITVAQIGVLTPAQVRMIGAAGPGGSVGPSLITWLNTGTWAALVSDPVQVAAITAAEVATLGYEQITSLGTNIQFLSDSAMGSITIWSGANARVQFGQMSGISVAQIAVLTPAQIGLLAASSSIIGPNTGIAFLNAGAFAALNATQVAVFTPTNMLQVSAAQLASWSTSTLAGLAPATIASLTPTQKASLNAAQHTACGC